MLGGTTRQKPGESGVTCRLGLQAGDHAPVHVLEVKERRGSRDAWMTSGRPATIVSVVVIARVVMFRPLEEIVSLSMEDLSYIETTRLAN